MDATGGSCLAGAVLNNYPHVDLPWDNVDCGAMGMAPLNSASASPARRLPLGGSGHLQYADRVNR